MIGLIDCMSKISLIIPHFPSPSTNDVLDQCITSFSGQYDELIVIVNDGMGFGPATNLGLKHATGDFLVVCNNDITLLSGSLRQLPIFDGISVPIIRPQPRDYKPRAIFCMPRWVYTQISSCGYFYDPVFEIGYWEDDDLIRRLGDIKVFIQQKVIVNHLDGGGLTMKQFGEQEWHDRNEQVFKNKWG